MKTYHDRMPMILDAKDFDSWFDGSLGPEAPRCASEIAFCEWLVSKRLNRTGVGNDDPAIIEPLSAAAASQRNSRACPRALLRGDRYYVQVHRAARGSAHADNPPFAPIPAFRG